MLQLDSPKYSSILAVSTSYETSQVSPKYTGEWEMWDILEEAVWQYLDISRHLRRSRATYINCTTNIFITSTNINKTNKQTKWSLHARTNHHLMFDDSGGCISGNLHFQV